MTPLATERSSICNYISSYFTCCKKKPEQESIKSLNKLLEEKERAIEENLCHIDSALAIFNKFNTFTDFTTVIDLLKKHLVSVENIRFKVRYRLVHSQMTCWGHSTRKVKYYTYQALSTLSFLIGGGSLCVEYLKKDDHNKQDHDLLYVGVAFVAGGALISKINEAVTKKWASAEKKIALMQSISQRASILIRHTRSMIEICSHCQSTRSPHLLSYEEGLKKLIHINPGSDLEILGRLSTCQTDEEVAKMLREGSGRILHKNSRASDISRDNIATLVPMELQSIQVEQVPKVLNEQKEEMDKNRTTPTPPIMEEAPA